LENEESFAWHRGTSERANKQEHLLQLSVMKAQSAKSQKEKKNAKSKLTR
jgi:hypothetical protein